MKEDVEHVLFVQNPQKILVRLLYKGQTWGLLPLDPLQSSASHRRLGIPEEISVHPENIE